MKPGVKILMVLTGIVTVMITTLFLTSRPMDAWMLYSGKGNTCECRVRSWEEIWEESDTVFTGRIVTVGDDVSGGPPPGLVPVMGDGLDSERAARANVELLRSLTATSTLTLTVERIWKDERGAPGTPIDSATSPEPLKEGLPALVHQVKMAGACVPMRYAVGSPYLIVAHREASAIVNGTCTTNRKWTRLDELFLSLGIGAPPEAPILVPSQVRGPMLLATMLLSAIVVALISYLGRDPDAG